MQEFDPNSFNGFVFPPSICNRPDVMIRLASVPYGAINDLSEIGVILIGGDAVCLAVCQEKGKAVEKDYEMHKVIALSYLISG
ncbi:unnamed protein product [Gongylonema pulchrum]|uniref:Uncharacterized protein n=1 Tax=Gongylonema pulchrum TaxID=637853 RepID=A0A3P7M9F7_9BILA|nr:unnamed protein product [Gongylonema pulchrum]